MVDTSAQDTLLDCIVHIKVSYVVWLTHVCANTDAGDLDKRVKGTPEVFWVHLKSIDLVLVHCPSVVPLSALLSGKAS